MIRALPRVPARTRPRLRRWAQAIVALLLLALLWRVADGPEALRSLAAADGRWLILGLGALTAQIVLSALRWRLTAGQLGIPLTVRRAVAEYYLSQVVNQSLPGGILGDAGRAVRSRHEAGLLAAGQAVVFERLAGQIALFATLLVAFLGTLIVPGGLDWPGWVAGPVAVALFAVACLPLAGYGAVRLPGDVGRRMRNLGAALRIALLHPDAFPRQVMLSACITLANLAAFALCARAVGVELSIPAIAALVPLILFTMLIPITISGWGAREGAAAALLPLAGVSASDGLAASIAFGLAVLASTLPGLAMVRLSGNEAKLPAPDHPQDRPRA